MASEDATCSAAILAAHRCAVINVALPGNPTCSAAILAANDSPARAFALQRNVPAGQR
ncbi:MAG TPA: hypothetical protein VH599_14685 [Ktedonobacterales bacterium]